MPIVLTSLLTRSMLLAIDSELALIRFMLAEMLEPISLTVLDSCETAAELMLMLIMFADCMSVTMLTLIMLTEAIISRTAMSPSPS